MKYSFVIVLAVQSMLTTAAPVLSTTDAASLINGSDNYDKV
ncbi:hypothetical protein SUNI508_06290 [Seiridium unicorne]|uniref:Uncharacterized protein n=1 Tax=Seiridium unicorne TaxID=138068 RepID=A0ABR2V0U3_9PEZI